MRHALNGPVRIAFDEAGEGAPLLLIHGLAYDSRGWGPALGLLERRFRTIRFDNRGVGESDAPRGPYSVRTLAGDALSVLDAAGVERAHVLGVSLGGLVAQMLAAQHPARVDRLVLVGTTRGGIGSYGPPAPTLALFSQAPALERDELLRRLVVNALAPATVARRPELVDEVHAYRRECAPRLGPWLAQAAAGAWFGIVGCPAPIAAPTLVLHGAADTVVDPRNARLLATAIPEARVVVFEHAGHLLFWEEPERFAEVVAGFLDGVSEAPAAA